MEAYIKAKYVECLFVEKRSEDEIRQKVLALSNQNKHLSGSSEAPPTKGPGSSVGSKPRAESSAKDLQVFSEPSQLMPGLQLYWASLFRSLPDMAEALAHGAEVNWINRDDGNRTPLIMAVHGGSLVTCEFLLQNSASVNQQDSLGRGPLHHATILGHTGQVCLFLKRGANQNAADMEHKTPLSIAVEAANADIVMLLLLAKMNEEMRESEGPYSQTGQYNSNSPTEVQYRKCMEEFISLQLGNS